MNPGLVHETRMDSFDLAILRALQRNGALTNGALAELVHLSPSQCSRRRQALEAAGIIDGYAARLDRRKLGFRLHAVVRVNLEGHGQDTARDFAAFIAQCDEVLAAYSVSGDADFVLDVCVRDLDAFAALVHDRLLPHPLVRQIRSEIVLKTIKESRELPL